MGVTIATAKETAGKRGFGNVRKLPSGRWQARYTGLDGVMYRATRSDGEGLAFDTRGDAEAWLSLRQSETVRQKWTPSTVEKRAPTTVQAYAEAWLRDRQLEDRTREHYAQLLRDHVYPSLGAVPVPNLEPARVRTCYAALAKTTGPTARSHAYGLLRTIMNSAVSEDELITANPCRVRGVGQTKRAKKIRPASLGELEVIATSVPPIYRLMILLAAWCALRFGELAELRRSDVDLTNGVVNVRRGVVRADEGKKVKGPKTDAGKRPVGIPPHLIPVIKAHLSAHAAMGCDGLLFSSKNGDQLAPSTLYKVVLPGPCEGRPLRPTLPRLAPHRRSPRRLHRRHPRRAGARLGHSTPGAAMRYQHAAEDRDRVIAGALSQLIAGDVRPIESDSPLGTSLMSRKHPPS